VSGVAAVGNPFPVLLDFLLGQSSLTTLVTGGDVAAEYAAFPRIFIGGLPSPPITHTLYEEVLPPTVVVRNAQLAGHPNAPAMQTGSVELRCYDIDAAAARALWYLTLNLLRVQTPHRLAGVSVEALNNHTGPFDAQEPGGGFLMATGRIPLVVLG